MEPVVEIGRTPRIGYPRTAFQTALEMLRFLLAYPKLVLIGLEL